MRLLFIILTFFSCAICAQEYQRNPRVPQAVWERLTPYFLPYNHAIRPKLDKLFSKVRVIHDEESLIAVGFRKPFPRKWTRLVVTKHPAFKGYIFKMYLDRQHYHQSQPEYVFWEKRIQGVNLIRREIKKRDLQHLFKTPKKWIYPLPAKPEPSKKVLEKYFILIEEEMDLLSSKKNKQKWHQVDKDFLRQFLALVNDLGLWDCSKPENAPFCKDGRVAFIDTQSFYRWPVKLDRLLPVLNEEMQMFWRDITKQ